jgi:hypothetical protein
VASAEDLITEALMSYDVDFEDVSTTGCTASSRRSATS